MKEAIATYHIYINRLFVNLRKNKREVLIFAPPVSGEGPEGCLCFGPRCGHGDADHDKAIISRWILTSTNK